MQHSAAVELQFSTAAAVQVQQQIPTRSTAAKDNSSIRQEYHTSKGHYAVHAEWYHIITNQGASVIRTYMIPGTRY